MRAITIKFHIAEVRRRLRKEGSKKLREEAINLMDCAISTLLDMNCKANRKTLEVKDTDLFM